MAVVLASIIVTGVAFDVAKMSRLMRMLTLMPGTLTLTLTLGVTWGR